MAVGKLCLESDTEVERIDSFINCVWPISGAGHRLSHANTTKHLVPHIHSQPATMTRRYNLGIALLLLTVVFSACGGDSTAPPPPTTGTLEFNIATIGVDTDADGFMLAVDGAVPRTIPSNGTVSMSLPPGTHTLAISGLAFNCDMTTAPASA